jgi:hypothetical protein
MKGLFLTSILMLGMSSALQAQEQTSDAKDNTPSVQLGQPKVSIQPVVQLNDFKQKFLRQLDKSNMAMTALLTTPCYDVTVMQTNDNILKHQWEQLEAMANLIKVNGESMTDQDLELEVWTGFKLYAIEARKKQYSCVQKQNQKSPQPTEQ